VAEKVSRTNYTWAHAVDTYPLAIVVEEGLELDDVGMPDDAHNLQFTVLLRVSSCAVAFSGCADQP
jgi:hypothetical protein